MSARPPVKLSRWSLSTQIFLAFALVVASTGAASLYAVAAVSALRHELGFLRQRALPLLDDLRQSAEALRGFDEALQRAAPEDLDWVVRLLPNARPYQRIDRIVARARREQALARPPQLARWVWQPQPALQVVEEELTPVRESQAARARMAGDMELGHAAGDLAGAADDSAAYELLASGLQRAIADRRLGDAARLAVEIRRTIRQVHVALGRAQNALENALAARASQAQRAESNLVAIVASTAGLSLLVSVLMLLASALALRPLAALTEVLRAFATGDRKRRAVARGAHEIAMLAEEWNRMADALDRRESQLLAQREELARAERLTALGHMAARMAHEVRNPLSSIGLNAEMLGEELQGDAAIDRREASELVAAIGAEVERLRVLTEGYLARTRPDQGDRKPVQCGELVREVVEFLRPELQQRNVTVQIGADQPVWAAADAAALRQLLWNLLRNAWEATGSGGRVWVQCRRSEAAGEPLAVLSVEDDGPGVPAPIATQIFEPFFSNKPHGTGIGLAVVQQIAKQHGGSVQLAAGQHGAGARFELALPACPAPDA